jgi:hypothetical protein
MRSFLLSLSEQPFVHFRLKTAAETRKMFRQRLELILWQSEHIHGFKAADGGSACTLLEHGDFAKEFAGTKNSEPSLDRLFARLPLLSALIDDFGLACENHIKRIRAITLAKNDFTRFKVQLHDSAGGIHSELDGFGGKHKVKEPRERDFQSTINARQFPPVDESPEDPRGKAGDADAADEFSNGTAVSERAHLSEAGKAEGAELLSAH